MSTYKCEFKARIEWIDLTNRHIVVVYSDPHGHEDIRQSIVFRRSDTIDDVKKAIIDATPHQRFHFRNEAHKQNPNDNTLEILGMLNTEMTYKLPTFNNEEI